MLDQIKSLGFNVIRIPFANQNLIAGTVVQGLDTTLNPDLAGLSPLQILDKIVDYCGLIGMSVILNRYTATIGDSTNEPLWYIPGDSYYTDARFLKDWVMLATRYRGTAVIGADLLQEPHNSADIQATWGTGNTLTDWNLAAQRVGNAIHAVNPDWLIIVEGTWENTWWGGNLQHVALNPIVLNIPNKVVYSAHEFSQDVYNQQYLQEADFPTNLRPRWDSFWGYLFRTNTAPIFIGDFKTNFGYPRDATWLTTLMNYLDGQLVADGQSSLQGGHQGMSWTFSCVNPTCYLGGILLDDFQTVDEYKYSFVNRSLATFAPSAIPTLSPTKPTSIPTTSSPSTKPSRCPTRTPSARPTTFRPSVHPSTVQPTYTQTIQPSSPTSAPTKAPTGKPTSASPSYVNTLSPTKPTALPTKNPTSLPTSSPTFMPSATPTILPTRAPHSRKPTSSAPSSIKPTGIPTIAPTKVGVLSTSGNQIVDSQGTAIRLTGLNW